MWFGRHLNVNGHFQIWVLNSPGSLLKCVKLSNSYIVTRSVHYNIWAKSVIGKLLHYIKKHRRNYTCLAMFALTPFFEKRPLNTRLLIQNVGLPTHIFTNSQFGILNFSDCSRFHEFSVYNLQVGKREAAEYPTSDTKCGVAHPWHWLCTWSRGKRRNELG